MRLRNLVFLSEYSEKNVDIGNDICDEGFSLSGYWLGDKEVDHSMIKSDSGIFYTKPSESAFKNFISSFVWDIGYKPDLLIIKGNIVDFWAVSSLVNESVFDFPCVGLIEDISLPLKTFEILVLNSFQKIYLLGENKDFFDFMGFLNECKDFEGKDDLLSVFKRVKTLEGFNVKNSNNTEGKNIKKEIKDDFLNNSINASIIKGYVVS